MELGRGINRNLPTPLSLQSVSSNLINYCVVLNSISVIVGQIPQFTFKNQEG